MAECLSMSALFCFRSLQHIHYGWAVCVVVILHNWWGVAHGSDADTSGAFCERLFGKGSLPDGAEQARFDIDWLKNSRNKPSSFPERQAPRLAQRIRDGLLEAIGRNPTDSVALAVYSDWLQEQADDRSRQHGELIHLWLMRRNHPDLSSDRQAAVDAQILELVGAVYPQDMPGVHFDLDRGLISNVFISHLGDVNTERLADILENEPLLRSINHGILRGVSQIRPELVPKLALRFHNPFALDFLTHELRNPASVERTLWNVIPVVPSVLDTTLSDPELRALESVRVMGRNDPVFTSHQGYAARLMLLLQNDFREIPGDRRQHAEEVRELWQYVLSQGMQTGSFDANPLLAHLFGDMSSSQAETFIQKIGKLERRLQHYDDCDLIPQVSLSLNPHRHVYHTWIGDLARERVVQNYKRLKNPFGRNGDRPGRMVTYSVLATMLGRGNVLTVSDTILALQNERLSNVLAGSEDTRPNGSDVLSSLTLGMSESIVESGSQEMIALLEKAYHTSGHVPRVRRLCADVLLGVVVNASLPLRKEALAALIRLKEAGSWGAKRALQTCRFAHSNLQLPLSEQELRLLESTQP